MMHNPYNQLRRVMQWASRAGYTCREVTMTHNIAAVMISNDDAPVFCAVEDFCRRSRWRYVCEWRGYHSVAVYLADDFRCLTKINAAMQAASDLFFAARRPDVYAAALPGYRAACVALGLDADRCAAVGVDAVPVC